MAELNEASIKANRNDVSVAFEVASCWIDCFVGEIRVSFSVLIGNRRRHLHRRIRSYSYRYRNENSLIFIQVI